MKQGTSYSSQKRKTGQRERGKDEAGDRPHLLSNLLSPKARDLLSEKISLFTAKVVVTQELF
jgi:hypothetical protein